MPRPPKLPPIETASDRNERAFRGFAPLYVQTRNRLRQFRGAVEARPPGAPHLADDVVIRPVPQHVPHQLADRLVAGRRVVVALVRSRDLTSGSTTRCCGLRWHRQTTSVRVCSPSSRCLATLGPRFAGLTALTTAARTLVRTGSCLSMPNPRPQDVAVDDLFKFVQIRMTVDSASAGLEAQAVRARQPRLQRVLCGDQTATGPQQRHQGAQERCLSRSRCLPRSARCAHRRELDGVEAGTGRPNSASASKVAPGSSGRRGALPAVLQRCNSLA